MISPIFLSIEKFKKWATAYSEIPEEERGGEWECDYDNEGKGWSEIWAEFDIFIQQSESELWSDSEVDLLLYIIARDNECESLAEALIPFPDKLYLLAERSLEAPYYDARWQLAKRLETRGKEQRALDLLERFVNDPNEYVNRIALMTMGKGGGDKTEHYCRIAWERSSYDDIQEYQRIAVLYALKSVHSSLLPIYLNLAKQDGRKYLVRNAIEIEEEIRRHDFSREG